MVLYCSVSSAAFRGSRRAKKKAPGRRAARMSPSLSRTPLSIVGPSSDPNDPRPGAGRSLPGGRRRRRRAASKLAGIRAKSGPKVRCLGFHHRLAPDESRPINMLRGEKYVCAAVRRFSRRRIDVFSPPAEGETAPAPVFLAPYFCAVRQSVIKNYAGIASGVGPIGRRMKPKERFLRCIQNGTNFVWRDATRAKDGAYGYRPSPGLFTATSPAPMLRFRRFAPNGS